MSEVASESVAEPTGSAGRAEPGRAPSGIQLGVTLFSFTNEWRAGSLGLASLIDQVGWHRLGPGLEVVGFQSFRGFPDLDREQVRGFREAVERAGLTPTALGSNTDAARRPGRFMDVDESTEYLSAQIGAANRLGFPLVRIQFGTTPAVIERIEPVAARAGIILGMEVHAPESATSPGVTAVREVYDCLQSEQLGFIPDFSATMTRIPDGQLARLRAAGLSEPGVARLVEAWRGTGPPHRRYAAFAEPTLAAGENPAVVAQARLAFTMCGHADPASWRELLPQTVHVHAKFYDVVDGEEPAIPYPDILQILASGYQGSVSSEWEGHAWADLDEADAFDLVRRHQDMCRRLLGGAA